MPEKHRRNFLKDKEARSLLNQVNEKFKVYFVQTLGSRARVELIETEFAQIYCIDKKPLFAKMGAELFPTLMADELFASIAKVVVDMGAIPYVCKGANVMRPGIRRFDGDFRKGDLVLVVDEKHGKPLAVGEILYDKGEAESVKEGVVVRNVHFVGDRVWGFLKEIC